MRAAIFRLRAIQCDREPKVLFTGKRKIFRKHADHGIRFAIELNLLPDNRGIAAELAAPQRIAQDCHVIVAGLVLSGGA